MVYINMDESSVKLSPPLRRGAVAVKEGWTRRRFLEVERRNPLNLRRAAVTYVAFVCDSEEIAKVLPQLLIGAEYVMQAWMSARLNQRDDNIFVLRRKTGWLNTEVVTNVVKLLAAVLQPFQNTHRFILMLDAAPVHLKKEVVKTCNRYGIYLMYVAASMTSILQPLDTHVFAQYKRYLREGCEDMIVDDESGELRTYAVLDLMIRAIKHVVTGRSWQQAFRHVGFGNKQADLSTTTLSRLALEASPRIPATLPTFEQLVSVYPTGADIPVHHLFTLFSSADKPARDPREPCAPPARTDGGNPWVGRLRSSSMLHVEQEAVSDDDRDAPSAPASSTDPVVPTLRQEAVPAAWMISREARLPRARRLGLPSRPPDLPSPQQ